MQMQWSQPVPAWHQRIFAQMNVRTGASYNYQGCKHLLVNTPCRYSKWTKIKNICVLYLYRPIYIDACCNYAFMHCVLLHVCNYALMH